MPSFSSSQKRGAALFAMLLLGWLFGMAFLVFSSRSLESLLQRILVLTLVVLVFSIPITRKAFQLSKTGFTEEYWKKQKHGFVVIIAILLPPTGAVFVGLALQNSGVIEISLASMVIAVVIVAVYGMRFNLNSKDEEL